MFKKDYPKIKLTLNFGQTDKLLPNPGALYKLCVVPILVNWPIIILGGDKLSRKGLKTI